VCAYICVSFRPKMLDLMGLGWLNDILLRAVVNPLAKLTMQDQLQGMCDTHCNTLQCTAAHCNTLQHTATHCNTLQHAAAQCNALQHTAAHCSLLLPNVVSSLTQLTMQDRLQGIHYTHCNTMQYDATNRNTLPHAASRCSTPQHTAASFCVML